ncbi:unnamed protein product [Miscanthus lutarioriparius]|uniref:F-box/LRR-repeat protein 15/At3g58940/PEG3-like LRR domain-containing protein n=1 Tax=Miscanthus lutarioriparius TaxID=422564 RepID=A0A811N7I3_9POAL|nr:unnamed protein product [Miscanthus lutarioriparius]
MAMVSGAKRRRGLEEEQEEDEDRISRLPDGILGDIVTLLPTNDGARTQGLPVTSLDGWLESPALDRLQELEFHYGRPHSSNLAPLPPPPASVHRFSSTLRAVSFRGCGFTDGYNASGLHFPVLKQLSLADVRFSESSLRALLSACPVLQSLLLKGSIGLSRVQIASPTLRSIGVRSNHGRVILRQVIIEDAPCLERLLCFDYLGITISVISAPKLLVLGPLSDQSPKLEFGTTVIQGGSGFFSLKMVVHSVKVLSLFERLSLDVVIEFMKCFPYLESLYIQVTSLTP